LASFSPSSNSADLKGLSSELEGDQTYYCAMDVTQDFIFKFYAVAS
jgi:hypothetical protein